MNATTTTPWEYTDADYRKSWSWYERYAAWLEDREYERIVARLECWYLCCWLCNPTSPTWDLFGEAS